MTTDILILSATTAGLVYSVDVGFTDNINLTTTLTAMATIPAIITSESSPTITVSAGIATTVTLSVALRNGFEDLTYRWRVTSATDPVLIDLNELLREETSSTLTVNFTPTETIVITLTAFNGDVEIPLRDFTIEVMPDEKTEEMPEPDKGIRLRAKVFLEGPLQ